MELQQILNALEFLPVDELRQVRARLDELLSLVEQRQRPATEVVETYVVPGGCYQLELVRCAKPRCQRCKERATHGLYWYHYQSRSGHVTKTFLGRERPAEVGTPQEHTAE
jgi:hypothetical protein